MATKILTVLIDDIDGSDADRTMSFQIDGTDYEIDLSAENAEKLAELLEPYLAAGRKVTRRTRQRTSSKKPMKPQASTASNIREWARRNGYPTTTRGRIPTNILEAREKATA